MRKVIHLCTGLESGGAEQMLLNILPRLNEEGLENIVFCIKGHGLIGKELEKQNVTVKYLGYERFYHLPRIIFRFIRYTREIKPDVLATYLIHADLFGRIMGRLLGIKKIIAYLHGSLLQWEFLRIFDRLTSPLVTQYLTVSSVLRKQLIKKYKFTPSKIKVLQNGINIDPYKSTSKDQQQRLKKTLGLGDDETILGVVANLRKGKGHKDLLKACKNLSVRLLIIGDGDEKEELHALAKQLGLGEKVLFLGYREDIPELLSIIDIFVLPTYFEGMSVALLQAMAAQKAIVTTNIDENKELVQDEDSALLVSPGDTVALAKALEKLTLNPKLREHLGKKAYNRCAEHFTLEKTIFDYKKIL